MRDFLWLISCVLIVFFFKQKTAYEMRISDWSSDVCSSDLLFCPAVDLPAEIIAGLAEIGQAGGLDIDAVQRGERVDHRLIGRAAVFRRRPRHGAVPDRVAVDPSHDIEPAADDIVLGAEAGLACDRSEARRVG